MWHMCGEGGSSAMGYGGVGGTMECGKVIPMVRVTRQQCVHGEVMNKTRNNHEWVSAKWEGNANQGRGGRGVRQVGWQWCRWGVGKKCTNRNVEGLTRASHQQWGWVGNGLNQTWNKGIINNHITAGNR